MLTILQNHSSSSNMSFLNYDISGLPKSCQSTIQRTGRCGCLACTGAVAPTLSSSSSSISESIRALLSGSSSSSSSSSNNNNNNNNTSNTSVNQSGDNVLDASELHLLTILSGIDKLRLERDVVEEASRLASSEPTDGGARRAMRKAPCSSNEDGVDPGMMEDDDLQILREIREVVEVVLERRRLMPVSQIRKWTKSRWEMDGKRGEKAVTAWGRVQKRLHLLGESGKRRCWRAVGKVGRERR
jgi:hypothetical protein